MLPIFPFAHHHFTVSYLLICAAYDDTKWQAILHARLLFWASEYQAMVAPFNLIFMQLLVFVCYLSRIYLK